MVKGRVSIMYTLKPIIGEVYIVNFRKNKRPAIVLTDTGNACMVAPIIQGKTDWSKYPYKVQVLLNNSADQFIDIKRLSIVSKENLIEKIGKISESDFENINLRIKRSYNSEFNSLNLNQYAEKEFEKSGRSFDEMHFESTSKPQEEKYHIFLSHSSLDKKEIAGIAAYFESFNYNVYVDSIRDSHLDPKLANRETASIMRIRMKNSKVLLFVFSKNSRQSSWMPWELGYFDGLAKPIAIFPIERAPFFGKRYKGQEYLNLYDFIDKGSMDMNNKFLEVVTPDRGHLLFNEWIALAT